MNFTCQECIEIMKPFSPTVPSRRHGRYLEPLCLHCSNRDGAREMLRGTVYDLEETTPVRFQPTPSQEIKQAYNTRTWQEVVELSRKVENTSKALANHMAEKPKKKDIGY